MMRCGIQGEEILENEGGELIFMGREFLGDGYLAKTAGKEVGRWMERGGE